MMSDRPNPIDLPRESSAVCDECGYRCDYKKACDLDGICPECGELLESDDE